MEDSKERLYELLAEAKILREKAEKAEKKINQTRNKWYNLLQNQIEIMSRKAQQGNKKSQIAFLNMLLNRRTLG